jgi:transcriptional regulator with XRE-family HTH domain
MTSSRKPTALDQIISNNICKLRKQKGYTVTEMAKVINISQAQMSKYEHAIYCIPASKLMLLAIAMNISILEFFKAPEN